MPQAAAINEAESESYFLRLYHCGTAAAEPGARVSVGLPSEPEAVLTSGLS
jgi:hypothetical protein